MSINTAKYSVFTITKMLIRRRCICCLSYRRTSKKVDKIRKSTYHIESSRKVSISCTINGLWKMVAVVGKYQNKIETTRLNCVHNYKENDF